MENITHPATPGADQGNGSIRDVGGEVLSKHLNSATPEKRGRGRPSNAEKAARLAGASPSPGNSLSPGQSPVVNPQLDLKAVSESFQSLFKSFDNWMVKRDERKIIILTGDESLARTLTKEVVATDAEVKGISDNFALCCQTYGWLGAHFPLVALGLGIAGYGAKRISISTSIAEIAQHVKKAKGANADRAQPVQVDHNGQIRDGQNVPRA